MSFEYSSIKLPNLFLNNSSHLMHGGAINDGDFKSPNNIVLPNMETLKSTIFIAMYILIVIVIIILLYYYFFPMKEGMSGGTLTQLYAQDSQNMYLNSADNGIMSGNFDLFWNQPSMVTQGNGTQRGVPLKEIAKNLPQTSMNPGLNNEKEKMDKEALKAGLVIPCENNCSSENPSQCGNSFGNICYLKDGFVESDDPRPFVTLNGTVAYPSSYLGSMFYEPNNPGLKPLPYMKPMDQQTLPYVKEGYK
jgi:hypothetical protein